jgi:hypothetical protein
VSPTPHLLLRSERLLWAVPGDRVRGIERDGDGVRILMVGGALHADEVLALARDLVVNPRGTALARYWPVHCRGTSIVDGTPVVVIDAEHPPDALRPEGDDHGRSLP